MIDPSICKETFLEGADTAAEPCPIEDVCDRFLSNQMRAGVESINQCVAEKLRSLKQTR